MIEAYLFTISKTTNQKAHAENQKQVCKDTSKQSGLYDADFVLRMSVRTTQTWVIEHTSVSAILQAEGKVNTERRF